MQEKSVSRRTFVKATGALGALAAGTGLASNELFSAKTPEAFAEGQDSIHWGMCNVNCGGSCIFKWHSKDGKIQYMETDDLGDKDLQARACLRGRSMRRWINHPDRLMKPLKRTGRRGGNDFEEISWDEALDIIEERLRKVMKEYGPSAVHIIYATGMYSATGKPINRLQGLLGGYLGRTADYSTHMMQGAMPYMFGSDYEKGSVYSPYDNYNGSSFTEAEAHSDLVVMFGNSPAETRMGGSNIVWDFARVREAVTARGGKIINIDYRLNETSSGNSDEWLPIRTGTDAALVAAIAHEWIKGNKVDKKFLDKYCVGYDEDTMPKSAKGKHLSYKDYIMGTGYDKVEKTPEWAAPITQIPADKIRELADTIASAKAPFIVQGWGPQRHSNGEEACRAISMLPILIGQIGLPGTNTGQREAEPPISLTGGLPSSNPCPVAIPAYQWLNAVDHGHEMTATNAGVTGADKLTTDIRFIWNYAGNCITNQHGDINKTDEILNSKSDEDLFIVGWDTVMNDSLRYSDIILPDAMRCEQYNLYTQGYTEYYIGLKLGTPAQEAPGECRSSYDVCTELAKRFGVEKEFTEGRTHDEWVKYLYENNYAAEAGIELPSWDEFVEQGVFKKELPPCIGFEAFRKDPVKNPLGTPSGKIEIYSEDLAELNDTWELAEDETIWALPVFNPGHEGYGSVTEEYPLYCSGFHHKSRTHSSFGFIEELEHVARQQAWINPADAEARGVKNGDQVIVTSPSGSIQIEALVTTRIIPGTVGIPQGAWHKADMTGDKLDRGGCVNTLSCYRPTPLAKGNGQAHSMIVEVKKA